MNTRPPRPSHALGRAGKKFELVLDTGVLYSYNFGQTAVDSLPQESKTVSIQ